MTLRTSFNTTAETCVSYQLVLVLPPLLPPLFFGYRSLFVLGTHTHVIWVELLPSVTSWLQGFSHFFFLFCHSDGFRDGHYSWASKSKSFLRPFCCNYQKKWPFWIGVCLVGWVWAWHCWWLFRVTGVQTNIWEMEDICLSPELTLPELSVFLDFLITWTNKSISFLCALS